MKAGSLFSLLGQNGAGKSTTINMLIGLLSCDGGDISFGAEMGDSREAIRKSIGVVFQNNVFDETLTVRENLLLYGMLTLDSRALVRQRYEELVALMALGDYANRRFGKLSGGQRRKAEIARALMGSPRILFLDEPTTGLDPRTRIEVWQIITGLQRQTGMTIFLTTHYLEETAQADHVVILHRGQIVCEGSPAELKSRYSHDRIIITPESGALLEKDLNSAGLPYTKTADSYTVVSDDVQGTIDLLSRVRANVLSFEVAKGTMDDVFLAATGETIRGDLS